MAGIVIFLKLKFLFWKTAFFTRHALPFQQKRFFFKSGINKIAAKILFIFNSNKIFFEFFEI